ncbi:MAG: LuxR C-terminal-related transcriptional regulator [Acidimicrobiia bacterium]
MEREQSSTAIAEVERAREVASRLDWGEAYEILSRIDQVSALAAEDLELLATSAFLTGNREESRSARMRAYHVYVQKGEARRAARCAVRLGLDRISTTEITQAGGCLPASMSGCTAWVVRAWTHLAGDEEGAELGYLLIPEAYEQLAIGGNPEGAGRSAARATEIGRRNDEPDLVAFALVIEGRALVRSARVEEGTERLQQATSEAASGRVSAPIAGMVLSSAVEAAEEAFDVERLEEWVDLLVGWCDTQKGMISFRTREMVYRAGLHLLRGHWDEAQGLATQAVQRALSEDDTTLAGAARYQLAEVHRLRGELAAAEEMYRESARLGHDPQPGLARLHMMRGDNSAAAASLGRALAEHQDSLRRARLLPAQVEILLAAGDIAASSELAEELADITTSYGGPVLEATAAQIRATVLVAEGQPLAALELCRRASRVWRHLDLPFEEARTRVLIARSCRALDDEATAVMELETAHSILTRLKARPHLAEVESLLGEHPRSQHGLTDRELEVLRLVAGGMTNAQIAEELVVSVRTVDTHVSNILTKLGVSSRSGATSYAHRQGLV